MKIGDDGILQLGLVGGGNEWRGAIARRLKAARVVVRSVPVESLPDGEQVARPTCWLVAASTLADPLLGAGWQDVLERSQLPVIVDLDTETTLRNDAARRQLFIDSAQPSALEAALRWAVAERALLRQHAGGAFLNDDEAVVREVLDALPQLFWTTDPQGNAKFFNSGWCDYTGVPLAGQRGQGWLECLHPDDRERVTEIWREAVRGGQDYSAEYRIRSASGEYRWFIANGQSRRDARGRIVEWVGTNYDIDALKRSQAEISELLALKLGILGSTHSMIVATDCDGRIISANAAVHRTLGYASEELVGLHTPTLLHDAAELATRAAELSAEFGEYITPDFEALAARARRGLHTECECTYLGKDGVRIPVAITITAMHDENGALRGFLSVAQDITERKRTEVELRAHEQKLRRLFELSPLGIALTDDQGRYVEFNEAFQAITGYEQDELCALDYWTLTPVEYAERELVQLEQLERSGRYGPYEKEYVRKDGSRVPLRLNGVRLVLEGQQYIWSIVEDITPQLEAAVAMQKAVDAAESANRAKSEFLANMSHEIRTPMNAIVGLSYLLDRTSLDVEQRGHVQALRGAGRSLLGLIDDVLDLSKIEAGRMELEHRRFQLAQLMEEVAGVMLGAARGKNIELILDPAPGLPEALEGDAMRLSQILTNLVGNAIKFTDSGSVCLSVREAWRNDGRSGLRFIVRDTGVGIESDKLAHIFDAFTQSDSSTTRRFGGSGLGLAIVRRLTGLMGGQFGAASEPQCGSEFWIEIPLRLGEAGEATPNGRLRPLEVLIADDHPEQREAIASTARSIGWNPLTAQSGGEVLSLVERRLAHRGFDAIVLDWRMPDLDGLSVYRRLQRDGMATETPTVLMISATDHEALRQSPGYADIDAVLTKPVTASALFNAVQKSLMRRHRDQALPSAEMPMRDGLRLPGVRVLIVDDSAVNLMVAQRILQSEGAQVATCGNGREAVERLTQGDECFDLVLMDVQMPILDGHQATRALRRDERLQQLPILALTAGAQSSERHEALSAGMNDFISKPFNAEALILTVRQHVERARGVELPVEPRPRPSAPLGWPIIEGIDTRAASQRLDGDHHLFLRLMRQWLESADVTGIPDHPPQDREQRRRLAQLLHRLRGTAGNLGASDLQATAAELEIALINEHTANMQEGLLRLKTQLHRLRQSAAPVLATDLPGRGKGSESADASQALKLLESLKAQDLSALSLFHSQEPQLEHSLGRFRFEQLRGHIEALRFGDAAAILDEAIRVAPQQLS